MGMASLRAMMRVLDRLQKEDSPRIHTLHPAVLSATRIDILRPTPLCANEVLATATQIQAGQGLQTGLKWRITSNTTARVKEREFCSGCGKLTSYDHSNQAT